MKQIPLANTNLVALVDDDDYNWLSSFKWQKTVLGNSKIIYAKRGVDSNTSIFMHTMIMNPLPGLVVDHIDWNGLNNIRSNMRLVTQGNNIHNGRKLKRNAASKFKGVSLINGKYWIARIFKDGTSYHLGTFKSELEAALAYDSKAVELYGPDGNSNKRLGLL